jgi:hypothetical protein
MLPVQPQSTNYHHRTSDLQLRYQQMLRLLFACFLTYALAACSAPGISGQASKGPQQKPSSTTPGKIASAASSLRPGTVLYHTDWSHGLAGWQATSDWHVVQGQLQVESNDVTSILLLYKPPVTNYAIEARIRVAHLLVQNGGHFSIFANKVVGRDGYEAGVSRLMGPGPKPNGSHPQAQIFINPMGSMGPGSFRPVDYEPHSDWHTYRIEIQNSQASFFIDGDPVGTATSDQTNILSNGPIGLSSSEITMCVSSFTITAL